jgi:hypothetical protein
MAVIDKSLWPNGMNSYTEPIAKLAMSVKPKNVLEIGLGYVGFSSAMFLEHCDCKITSLDKCDWGGKGKEYQELFPERFKFIEGRSEDVLPKLKREYDLIYIDGDHSYEGAKADIINCIPLLAKGGVLVLDDYGVTSSDRAVNLDDDSGAVITGPFGVKDAADELLQGWEQVYKEIDLGNGGRAYVAPQSR